MCLHPGLSVWVCSRGGGTFIGGGTGRKLVVAEGGDALVVLLTSPAFVVPGVESAPVMERFRDKVTCGSHTCAVSTQLLGPQGVGQVIVAAHFVFQLQSRGQWLVPPQIFPFLM